MSYDYQQNQDGHRPGFSAAPQDFGSGGFPAQSNGGFQPSQGSNNPPANNANSNGSAYNSNANGYSAPAQSGYGNQRPNGGGQNQNSGGGGGWKGNNGQSSGGFNRGGSGGGGWKGGGGKGGFQRPQLSPEELANLPLPKAAVLDGNFRAPDVLIPVIREISELLHHHKFAIRSGGMDGFGKLVSDNVRNVEHHIPFKDFNQIHNPASSFNSDECKEYAKRFMPDWGTLKDSHQTFFCKNVRTVLGKSLKQPVQIAIIWSEDGVEGPATRTQQSMHAGHIAAICKAMNIPVINISNPDAVQRLRRFLEA